MSNEDEEIQVGELVTSISALPPIALIARRICFAAQRFSSLLFQLSDPLASASAQLL